MTYQIVHIAKENPRFSPLVARVLAASSLSKAQIEEIVDPNVPLATSQAPCVQEAARRIRAAKEAHEKVLIGGDYDCDGICATAIMKALLDRLGIVNGYYIPDRFKEGYGLGEKTVRLAKERGYTLLITVDNGVKAHAALRLAKQMGMDTIVTDHHMIEEQVEADILVHPERMEEEYSGLCGAGVAYELSRYMLGDIPSLTGLAAVASIGDVMPLWAQTRAIVRHGFAAINAGALPSVGRMLAGERANLESVAFRIVPKLNAVGRMQDDSNVNTLVPFLLSDDPLQLAGYAAQLEKVNNRRKNISARMSEKAEALLDESAMPVLYDDSFQEGICGLVAGRLCGRYHRPFLVAGKHDTLIKGSGRSVPGFNLFTFFQDDFPELTAFGGHAQAVGFALRQEDFAAFKAKCQRKMEAMHFTFEPPVKKAIAVDSGLLTLANVKDLDLLDPLPKEVPTPLFAIENPVVIRTFRSPKVTKYSLQTENGTVDAVLFAYKGLAVPESFHTLLGTVSVNRWQGKESVQMEIYGFID